MVLQSIFLNSQNVVYNSDEKTFNKLKFKFSTPGLFITVMKKRLIN